MDATLAPTAEKVRSALAQAWKWPADGGAAVEMGPYDLKEDEEAATA
jgi:hypothetical protein